MRRFTRFPTSGVNYHPPTTTTTAQGPFSRGIYNKVPKVVQGFALRVHS